MSAGVSVAATGSALAFLLFENGNSKNNQAGYLLGDVVSEKKNLISDSDDGQEKTVTVVHVHAVIQDESLSSSYSLQSSSYLNSNAFKKIEHMVVGWYSFRRNVTAVPTLKDRLIHKQLLQKLGRDSEKFLFCLLTSSENNDSHSHSFRQHFLVYNPSSRSNRKFEAVSLLIENLANISPQYRAPLPPIGEAILQNLIDPNWNKLKLVANLQEKLTEELQGAVSKLLSSEKMVNETEQKLLQLIEEHAFTKKRLDCMQNRDLLAVGDVEGNVSRDSKRKEKIVKVDEGGDCGESNLNSVDLACVSDDESPTSPVLGSAINKRPARNFPRQ